jgi:oligopeptidase B
MPDTPQPPIAAKVSTSSTYHAHTLVDEYAWLQDKNSPQTLEYLRAENAHTQAATAHTQALREQLFAEMKGRIKEADAEVPARRGGFLYYTRTEAGRQYPIHCRKPFPDGPEQLLLDVNTLAEGHSYCKVGAFEPSPDGNLLAYSVDTTGAIVFALFVKDLRTGETLLGGTPNVAYGAAWANDNRTLFYTTFDDAHRPHKLHRHTLGDDPAGDAQLFHEPDEAFHLYLGKSRSDAFLLMTLRSGTTSEVHYLSADDPGGDLAVIEPRRHRVEYYADHHGDRFLIRTNDDGAENFKLMAAPVARPGRAHWRELLPHRPDTLLDAMAVFADYLVLAERRGGLQQLRISDPDAVSNARYVEFPEPVYTIWEEENYEYGARELRFGYSSLVTPPSVIDYDMASGAWQLRKQEEIPSGYDATLYRSERIAAPAADGALVPISLVYRADLRDSGPSKLLLYGYGSYGYTIDPAFSASRLSLLDRGWIFAIAHIRGGSDLGRAWYESGRLLHKKNSFGDFIASAEHLIARGYTTPERLAIQGASAGGLLMGAVVNARPELFGAVVAQVPFMNVIAAITDPSLPLTVIEYEQWGNPEREDEFGYMLSYSPYENIRPAAYPPMLVTGGLNDLQVPYWDPAKWVARLRATKTDANPLLLQMNMEAGHGGASGRYDHLKETAQIYAFLIDTLE